MVAVVIGRYKLLLLNGNTGETRCSYGWLLLGREVCTSCNVGLHRVACSAGTVSGGASRFDLRAVKEISSRSASPFTAAAGTVHCIAAPGLAFAFAFA